MGLINSKPEEKMTMTTPFFRSPFTDVLSTCMHSTGTECAPFEIRMLDCYEAYGTQQAPEKCKLLYQDFKECTGQWKQLNRVEEMKRERRRQWIHARLGRSDNKTTLWVDAPPQDSFAPDPLYE